MPRIIRSSVVNIDRAGPIVVPMREEPPEEARQAPPPQPAADQARMDQIYSSAEMIVEEIISKARSDADNMLVDAREETMKVLQEAVREGREQGIADALREMHELQDRLMKETEAAIEELRAERVEMIRQAERDVIDLVLDIAEKVLSVEMNRSSEWIEALVKTALQQMEGDEGAVMRVSSKVRKKVAEAAERMLAESGKQSSQLIVSADTAMGPGGCVIETGRGVIDAGIEHKLDKIKSVLHENA